ncbi:response regulator transcription factor [Muribaculum intestinale]|uniref:response regulator transcription factor n=1 Tax=Muribaculum intestinale TaxID=1796646 RepID=UPI0010938363|nr:response regulator transcription factor [Muribaculum intestinale]TGX80225.1 response regulator transcription factor [Muribaculum intestinale]
MVDSATFILTDNQDITRAGMHGYISFIFSNAIITEAHDKKQLVAYLSESSDSIVVLDYTLFDINGIDEFLIIARRFPSVHWILFSNELSDSFIRRISAECNISMILKETSADEIHCALLCACHGERFICHQIANMLIQTPERRELSNNLTPTETDILIAKGMTVKEIASERISSIHTIVTHKKNIFRKLGINNVYEATKYALRAGLVEIVEYYI